MDRLFVGMLILPISIHALHTECDIPASLLLAQLAEISIHALHTECDGGYKSE